MARGTTIKGIAFEYATCCAFATYLIGKKVAVDCEINSDAYRTAKRSFESLDESTQRDYRAAAEASIDVIIPLEPKLTDLSDCSPLRIRIQTDAQGQQGDVRDIVLARPQDDWEIGISCKHNHEALKHPRVTKDADFGSDWIGTPCSDHFLNEVASTMALVEKHVGEKWDALPKKHERVYIPILDAYIAEIARLCEVDPEAPSKLLAYFFGHEDFYKVIAMDRRVGQQSGLTKTMAFNMHGTLGKASGSARPIRSLKKVLLPDKLITIGRKDNSNTTIEIVLSKGWVVKMRLHSADKAIKTTGLKWDVTLAGMPTDIYMQERTWE